MDKVEFTNYEKEVLDTFFKVVKDAGPYGRVFDYRSYADWGYCIQKIGNTCILYGKGRKI